MSRKIKRWFVFGVLLASIGCQPVQEEEEIEPVQQETITVEVPLTAVPTTTSVPPPEPTSLPTAMPDAWLRVGNQTTGLQLSIPPDWVNLSGSLDTVSAANALGLVVLLTSDSQRTGSALLAGKGTGEGAYAAGMITHFDLSTMSLSNAMNAVYEQFASQPAASPAPLTNISQMGSDGETIEGVSMEFDGTAVIFPDTLAQQMRTRLLMFPLPNEGQAELTQAVFVFSAESSVWSLYQPIFDRMLKTVTIHDFSNDIVINDGRANVVGSLGITDRVNGRLESGVSDIWTFQAQTGQYATMTVSPDDKEIDLIIRLIDPAGKTVAQFDNAFAGDSELIVDYLLLQDGTFVIEVSEFFKDSGRYTLSLVLTDEPLYIDTGEIDFGQTIQNDLPITGQKVWLFNGEANETISIVLIPEGDFDGILDLYAPNGDKLLTVDEGFSGDAELIAGYYLPFSGQYSIVVRSFAGNGGAYSLSLDLGGEDISNFYDAGDLIFGETKNEMLRANEAHAWFFDGKRGDNVTIMVTPLNNALDLDVWLLDPNIERINLQDVFLAGESERVEQRLPLDGQYLILVSDFYGMAGPYEISLTAQPIATPQPHGVLELDTPVDDTLGADETNIWYFEGETGDSLTIELTTTSSTADLAFDIVNPDGIRVRLVDEQTSGADELLEQFTLTEDGRWGIIVKEFYQEAADYSLVVKRAQ